MVIRGLDCKSCQLIYPFYLCPSAVPEEVGVVCAPERALALGPWVPWGPVGQAAAQAGAAGLRKRAQALGVSPRAAPGGARWPALVPFASKERAAVGAASAEERPAFHAAAWVEVSAP